MTAFSCTGRDKLKRTFEYSFVKNNSKGEYTFRVTTNPPPTNGAFFELGLSTLRQGTVRVEMANHFNRAEYVAMGIPEALLPIVKQQLGMNVESSPTRGGGNVYRTPAATKYWQRLKKSGGATYDADRDVYSVV